MSDDALRYDGAVTIREGFFDDWYVVECADFRRLGDADCEGTAEEMGALAEAIERRATYSAKRCAVDATGDRVRLWSPRNSTREASITLAAADALASQIRATVPGVSGYSSRAGST